MSNITHCPLILSIYALNSAYYDCLALYNSSRLSLFLCVFFVCCVQRYIARKSAGDSLLSIALSFFGFDFFQTISIIFCPFWNFFSKIALLNNKICLGIDKYDLLAIFFVYIF